MTLYLFFLFDTKICKNCILENLRHTSKIVVLQIRLHHVTLELDGARGIWLISILFIDIQPNHTANSIITKSETKTINKLAKLIVLPSALICTDQHWWQWWAMMTMMDNDGQWWQWRQWWHWRYRCFKPLPYLATLTWRQCLRTGTLLISVSSLPQSQCYALALWRRAHIAKKKAKIFR